MWQFEILQVDGSDIKETRQILSCRLQQSALLDVKTQRMTKSELCGQRQEVKDLFLNIATITRIKLAYQERACKLNLLILLFDEHFLTSKRLSDFVGFCQPIKLVSALLQENYQETRDPLATREASQQGSQGWTNWNPQVFTNRICP